MEEAAHEFKIILEVRERTMGPDAADVGDTLNDLGSAEIRLHRSEDAVAHLNRALAIRKARLGEDHPRVADTMTQLGLCFQTTGRFAEAEASQVLALRIRRKALGDEHRDVTDLCGGIMVTLVMGGADYRSDWATRVLLAGSCAMASQEKIETQSRTRIVDRWVSNMHLMADAAMDESPEGRIVALGYFRRAAALRKLAGVSDDEYRKREPFAELRSLLGVDGGTEGPSPPAELWPDNTKPISTASLTAWLDEVAPLPPDQFADRSLASRLDDLCAGIP